mgnify:CR=1 FL=1|jgi:hypothetical protein
MPSAFFITTRRMKKKRITYGVNGMMEYQAIIKIGRATLKVLFSDGSMTAMGENPAHFTTTDFITQHAIENCRDFKRGLIKKLNVIELDEEVHIERNLNADAKKESVENADLKNSGESLVQDVSDDVIETTVDESSEKPTADETTENVVTEVEFNSNQEAKDFLSKSYGVKSSAMRTRADIIAAGEANGVKIIFVTE